MSDEYYGMSLARLRQLRSALTMDQQNLLYGIQHDPKVLDGLSTQQAMDLFNHQESVLEEICGAYDKRIQDMILRRKFK